MLHFMDCTAWVTPWVLGYENLNLVLVCYLMWVTHSHAIAYTYVSHTVPYVPNIVARCDNPPYHMGLGSSVLLCAYICRHLHIPTSHIYFFYRHHTTSYWMTFLYFLSLGNVRLFIIQFPFIFLYLDPFL